MTLATRSRTLFKNLSKLSTVYFYSPLLNCLYLFFKSIKIDRMPVDELPMYPTPQQAAYTVGNQPQGSSRKQSHPKQSNVVYRPAQHLKPVPSQYSHLQPHNAQTYQVQPPADYQGQYHTDRKSVV